MLRYCFIVLLLFIQSVLSQSVQAQMYQWVDPETGTTQLSGKPPAWYRSTEGGPRVFVFNRGKAVDDTGIDISDQQRIRLRTKAFIRAEGDELAAREKVKEAAKLKEAMQRNADEKLKQDSEIARFPDEPQNGSHNEVVEASVAEELAETETREEESSVEKMKALIAEWESKRTEEARALLQQGNDKN
ncbi:MAG: hypothetical protein KAJ03_11675 [Gammaproteobacteria bacterium]|nr:hypothetical protein [Gammaproteobacteria bacterium]